MKRLAAAFLILLAHGAHARNFEINWNYLTDSVWNGELQNIAAVNSDSQASLYVALPTTKVGEIHLMKFTNFYVQPWTVANKYSSGARWLPVGPAVDLRSYFGMFFEGADVVSMITFETWNCPLVLDMARNGMRFGAKGVSVLFDIDGNGTKERTQWTRKGGDEAFLALDVNRNGRIDNGRELFGNHTFTNTPNGFLALARYDNNADRWITSQDSVFGALRLWTDLNADGISQSTEITRLREITALPTKPFSIANMYDAAGNYLPLWAFTRGTLLPITVVDVGFKRL